MDCMSEPSEGEQLVQRAAAGDGAAMSELLQLHRDKLVRMVRLRLDPRLKDRIDASDVVQEAQLEALQRFAEYARTRPMPLLQWLRFLTGQKLLQMHRHHLGAQCRDARHEVPLPGGRPSVSCESLGEFLVGNATAPSDAAMRDEQRQRLLAVLEAMDEIDREILVLRHFEQLSNVEAAAELGLQESAASKRYLRALLRLQQAMGPASSA